MIKKSSKNLKINSVILIQFVLSLSTILGYFIGILGSLFLSYYTLVAWWLIPIGIINIVLNLKNNQTILQLTITNFICSVLTLIPIFGLLPAFVGIVVSAMLIYKIFPDLTKETS